MREAVVDVENGRATAHELAFRTRQPGDPDGYVRSFGTVAHVETGSLRAMSGDAIAHVRPAPSPNCARDKVALVAPIESGFEAACYQISDAHTEAEITSCGNTVAAVAASCAQRLRSHPGAIQVDVPGPHTVTVHAHVNRVGPDALVRQTWQRVPYSITASLQLGARTGVACTGALNNYLIVQARPGDDPFSVGVDEAIELWHEAGFEHDPLLARLAVLQPDDDGLPRAKFFTCGEREHPSAPLTGLAVLALVSERLGWPWRQLPAAVDTPAGPIRVPRLFDLHDQLVSVQFPPVLVDLDDPPIG